MSDNKKEVKIERIGTCAYCGQIGHIEASGELSQAEVDAMATDMCICLDAVNAKRKKVKEAKIKEFVKQKFVTDEMCNFLNEAIELLNKDDFEEFTFKQYPDKVTKIWKDNSGSLNIRIRKTESDEFKA